jgi:thiol-disulfide isomerase/thioredoxin
MPAIPDATDADLRFLTYKHKYVIAKFIDEDCTVCQTLAPSFQRFADDAAYQDVLFLRIDASENPVYSKEVKLSGTPFFATYKDSIIQRCGLVETEQGIKVLLDKLLES